MIRIFTIKHRGIITHVILGWIAARVPSKWNAKHAKLVGVSSWPGSDGIADAYWDISLDGKCVLHVLKESRHVDSRAFFFAKVPL